MNGFQSVSSSSVEYLNTSTRKNINSYHFEFELEIFKSEKESTGYSSHHNPFHPFTSKEFESLSSFNISDQENIYLTKCLPNLTKISPKKELTNCNVFNKKRKQIR